MLSFRPQRGYCRSAIQPARRHCLGVASSTQRNVPLSTPVVPQTRGLYDLAFLTFQNWLLNRKRFKLHLGLSCCDLENIFFDHAKIFLRAIVVVYGCSE